MTPTGALTAWATVLTTLIGVAIGMVLIIGYVIKVDRDAEQRNIERQRQICGIIAIIDDTNQSRPPAADQETARFRQELHAYRLKLGC